MTFSILRGIAPEPRNTEMTNTLENNKKAAKAFYDLMFNRCLPRQAIEQYAGGVYIHHNPEVGVLDRELPCANR